MVFEGVEARNKIHSDRGRGEVSTPTFSVKFSYSREGRLDYHDLLPYPSRSVVDSM
jgi:hypothetical protein